MLGFGSLVEAGDGGFEGGEALVDGGAEGFDFFGEREEPGVDSVAYGVELLVEFDFGEERGAELCVFILFGLFVFKSLLSLCMVRQTLSESGQGGISVPR